MHKCFFLLAVTGAIGFAQQASSPMYNPLASREIGQPALLQQLNNAQPNLVEGRELNAPVAIAFDKSVSPPILYIADTFNNRILAWKNPAGLTPCGVGSALPCGKADLVIGQRDFTGTLPNGPNAQGAQALTSGFTLPMALAVDGSGNLYVADAGNNRVLRFPAPFQQTSSILFPDLVIGQTSVNTGTSQNMGQQSPSAQSLYLYNGTPLALRPGLAIDPRTGDLWVTDSGNNRALHFPVSQLAAGTAKPAADFALGQLSLTANSVLPTSSGQPYLNPNSLSQPSAIAFDQNAGLYIADNAQGQLPARILYYMAPLSLDLAAARILGIAENLAGQPTLPPINKYGINIVGGLAVGGANGLNLFASDIVNNRVVEYDIPANWPAKPAPGQAQTVEDAPPMIAVTGQADFNSGMANKGQAESDATTFSTPLGLAFNGTDLWVADEANNRALKFPSQSGIYSSATGLAGQVDFPYSQPNLIEGREMYFAAGNLAGGDVALDTSTSPPHLYIADTFNNRILGFKNAFTVQPGETADIVIGQGDESVPNSRFYRSVVNFPSNLGTNPTNQGLSLPEGVLVDASGNLWVADTGNGRVLRYPTPFGQAAGAQQLPNLVLGQPSFTIQDFDATQQTMNSPYGLAIFSNGSIAVSDTSHNRILVFNKPSGGDFTNGQNAAIVLGEPDFSSTTASNGAAGLSHPRHMAVDTSDRLYVADAGNNRMLVFNNPSSPAAQNGGNSAFQLNVSSITEGVAVNESTGEIWLTFSNVVWLLPQFDKLVLSTNPNSPYEQQIQLQTVPFSMTLDSSNNPVFAEQANRVSFYYPEAVWQNASNYNSQPLAPGQLALLYRLGQPFVFSNPTAATELPLPPTLGDLQLTVNGVPAPMFRVDSGDFAFQVPYEAPQSGTANFILTRYSTGEILATRSVPMAQYNPGFFTSNAQGTGLVAANNYAMDGTYLGVNSATNPIPRDGQHFIVFYLTGAGVFGGGPGPSPADGVGPAAAVSTTVQPLMLNASFGANGIAPASDVLYSGAAPGLPGVWQINWKVEQTIPPSSQTGGVTIVALELNSVASSVGPNGNPGSIQVWFYTK